MMYVWALTYHSIYAEAIEHPRYLFLPSTLLEVRVHMRGGAARPRGGAGRGPWDVGITGRRGNVEPEMSRVQSGWVQVLSMEGV